jgi:penicillin G amidase
MRRRFVFIPITVVLITLLLSGVVWWRVRRALPEVEGTQQIPGLKSGVTIGRDARGVPHIEAQSFEDVFFAQGYVMAQDRLWQMDLVRRAAAGRLSEIAGTRTREIDRSFRQLGLNTAAEREVSLLGADERRELEAFARGVNRYLEERHPLPIEFAALWYEPEPWHPADTLLVLSYMYQTLTSSWQWDLDRVETTRRAGTDRAAILYDDKSPYDHPVVDEPGPAPGGSRILSVPLRPDQPTLSSAKMSVGWAVPDLTVWGIANRALFEFDGEARAAFGSNNWVVDGSHTVSGKPLLANDTHLALMTPDIWYMVHLNFPGWNVEGFTLPGVPGIVIGHNDHIAWGLTNTGADVQDVYEEALNPANSQEYRDRGQWVQAQVRKEVIAIRGQAAETLDVVATRHGPIVQKKGNTGYALRWTATEPGGLAHSYLKVPFARNWQEFRESLRDTFGPAQNVVYADVDGHIGFLVAGRIPVRKCGEWPPPGWNLSRNTPCGAAPLPGDSGDYEWDGYVPFDQMPQMLDPRGGIIATANARVTGATYPYYVTANWKAPWRADRIHRLLNQPVKFTTLDMAAVQTDIVSEIHLIVAKAVVRAAENSSPRDARTRAMIHLLAAWDGQMEANSSEAAFTDQIIKVLRHHLFRPYWGDGQPDYPGIEVFLDRVLQERPPIWLPAEFHDYDSLLSAAADEAVGDLARSTGRPNFSDWHWGQENKLFMPHPLAQSGILARFMSIGPVVQSGAPDCIKAMGPMRGPALRMVADLSNWDRSLMEITTGESGEVGSSHYSDQFPDWFAGRAQAAPFSNEAVSQAAVHALRLVPAIAAAR